MHDCIRCSHLSGELLLILAPAPGPVPFRNGVYIYIWIYTIPEWCRRHLAVLNTFSTHVPHLEVELEVVAHSEWGPASCSGSQFVKLELAGPDKTSSQPFNPLSLSQLCCTFILCSEPQWQLLFFPIHPLFAVQLVLCSISITTNDFAMCSYALSVSLARWLLGGFESPILHSFKAISWRSYPPQPSKALDFHWLCTSAFFRCLFQLLQLAWTATNLGCTASSSLINYLEATCLLLCWKSQTLSLWPLR